MPAAPHALWHVPWIAPCQCPRAKIDPALLDGHEAWVARGHLDDPALQSLHLQNPRGSQGTSAKKKGEEWIVKMMTRRDFRIQNTVYNVLHVYGNISNINKGVSIYPLLDKHVVYMMLCKYNIWWLVWCPVLYYIYIHLYIILDIWL